MPDLNDFFYFAAIVSHRGFAAAARALGVPKSSLSRRVARLEARLGVRLIERSSRRFGLTEIGEEFYQRCRAVLAEAEAAEDAVARVRAEPRGLVRASCPPGMVPGALAAALPDFLAANPHVRLQLLVTNRRVDLIEERVDVAIRVRTRLDTEADFQMRALGRARSLLAASPGLLDNLGRPATPAELAKLPTLGFSERPGSDVWVLHGPDGATASVAHEPRMACADFTALMEAALAGTGVGLLPELAVGGAIQAGRLERVLPDWQGDEALVHLIFPPRRAHLPAVRRFIDFLVDTLAPACDALARGDAEAPQAQRETVNLVHMPPL
jgi:DNA-binding transcriptional LysR family regulator